MSRGRLMSIKNIISMLALILMGGSGDVARADTFPPAPQVKDAAGAPPLAERARTLLTTQCASCHKGHASASQAAGAGFDASALTLQDLASDPGLVRPGFAEASPLFQVLLSRHRPTDLGPGGLSGAELLTVRDWIESLPTTSACRRAASNDMQPIASNGRVLVTLRHLAGGCTPAGRIAEYRALSDEIMGALSRDAAHVPSDDPNGLSFEVEIARLDRLTGADLEALRALIQNGSVPLDALAALVTEQGLPVRDVMRPRVAALARLWTRDVDLERAAADVGTTEDALAGKLRALTGEASLLSKRLLQGTLPRGHWEALRQHLAGNPAALPVLSSETGVDVSLETDTAKAKIGDLLSLRVTASAPCHLTIVSIDPAGRAIVLYPNEIEETNLIAAGVPVTVPGPQAGYQVRFDKTGTETFFAICQRGKTSFEGVKVDYEKQRFPVLGDWRGFIAVMDLQQAKIEKDKQSRDTRRARRRGRDRESEVKQAAPPVDPKSNIEGYSALRITVE